MWAAPSTPAMQPRRAPEPTILSRHRARGARRQGRQAPQGSARSPTRRAKRTSSELVGQAQLLHDPGTLCSFELNESTRCQWLNFQTYAATALTCASVMPDPPLAGMMAPKGFVASAAVTPSKI